MRNVWTVTAIALSTLLVGLAGARPTAAEKCQEGKNKEVGKYAACRQKAEASLAVSGDAMRYAASLQKCLGAFEEKWATLEAKAVEKGASCPSVGDQTSIGAVIDDTTTSIATALAGGTLAVCPADLEICEADLATCLAAPRGQLLKTGQTTCYHEAAAPTPCAGTGQDGERQSGLSRTYVDNGDGTISDAQSGLMWGEAVVRREHPRQGQLLHLGAGIHQDCRAEQRRRFRRLHGLAGAEPARAAEPGELRSDEPGGVSGVRPARALRTARS